jgi:tryptophan 2,3-dioxygenase
MPAYPSNSPLSYNLYLRVPELIALQNCRSPHKDELLFIIIHQAYELWFRLVLHEVDYAAAAMQQQEVVVATRHLERIVAIMRLLVQQIHILETMLPSDFIAFRDELKPASGFQSSQFREIEFVMGLKDRRVLQAFSHEPDTLALLEQRLAAPALPDLFYQLLAAMGWATSVAPMREDPQYPAWYQATIQALIPLYQKPLAHYPLLQLAERLLDFDEQIGLWRYHHIKTVERLIGHKQGTGGSEGVGYLQKTLALKALPELWEVRTYLDQLPPQT